MNMTGRKEALGPGVNMTGRKEALGPGVNDW